MSSRARKRGADDTQIEYLNGKETNWIHFPFLATWFPSFFEGRKKLSLYTPREKSNIPPSTTFNMHATDSYTLDSSHALTGSVSHCRQFFYRLHCITFSPRDESPPLPSDCSDCLPCFLSVNNTCRQKSRKTLPKSSHRIFFSRTTCMFCTNSLSS